MTDISRLIHLNGPPGVGKTSLARRYLADHPLSLMVDVDTLRVSLGQWETHEESRLLARELALALIGAHLAAGHDVVIPQYLGRIVFIERLQVTAEQHRAAFVEVLIVANHSTAVDRFRRRREKMGTLPDRHPEADVNDSDVDEIVTKAIGQLAEISRQRPETRTVPATGDLEQTYRQLLATLNDPSA